MPDRNIKLEIPVFSADDAISAAEFGADRLELCTSYKEGGLTPGPGLFSYLKRELTVPIFVMVRPRAGDFYYSASDLDVLKEEIIHFKKLGADGFVFGMLNRDGSVQTEACRDLVRLANGIPCTFHRAFDECKDPIKSLRDIIDCGFSRLLTSGQRSTVKEGIPLIKKLQKMTGNKMIVMPGGGMKPEFIHELNEHNNLKEVHASCRKTNINGIESLRISEQKVKEFMRAFV